MHPLLSVVRPPTTPCLVVLEPVLERNLKVLQDRCDAAGVGLRPHAKMHKSSEIARRQTALGAVGVCAQTVGEAEAMIAGGIRDVLVTAPPPPREAERIWALAARAALAVVVDDPRLATALSAARPTAPGSLPLRVLLDVDLGQRRSGVLPEDVPAFAARLEELAGLRLVGLQGYVGHVQHLHERSARRAAAAAAAEVLGGLAAAGRSAGRGLEILTGGGTGTVLEDLEGGVYTEVQAGSYAYMDAEYGACEPLEGPAWPFEPALFLAASVVSARRPGLATIDAGLKALSSDGPPPRVVSGGGAGASYLGMGDEHGAILTAAAASFLKGARDPLAFSRRVLEFGREGMGAPATPALEVGDLVWLQPGHCDPTVNLHEAFYLADADGRLERVPVDGRRKIP